MEAKIDGQFPGIPYGIFPSMEIAEAALYSGTSQEPMAVFEGKSAPKAFASVNDRISILTIKEQEIAILVTKGFSSKGIAAKLKISKSTVSKHREHINRKTGTKSPVQLLHWLAA